MVSTKEFEHQLDYQISLVKEATRLCKSIKHSISDPSLEELELGKIDFYQQKLITELYTIDAIHINLKDNEQLKKLNKYSMYLKLLQELITHYGDLIEVFKQQESNLGKKLFWQDLFISSVFKNDADDTVAENNKHKERELAT